jgi:hypothetical protein
MKYTLYIIAVMLVISSCAAPIRHGSVGPCTGELPAPFPPFGEGRGVSIAGRVKIVLPKYRVRGRCRIWGEETGRLVIDFEHSSLFGAYREEATIVIQNGDMTIFDRERGVIYGTEESLSMLGDEIAFDLYPDDIAYALLLNVPECDAIEGLTVESDGARWRLSGAWRGRNIGMEGRGGEGVERFVICANNKNDCYTINYRRSGGAAYPSELEMVRNGGVERIYLEVIEAQSVSPAGVGTDH